MVLKFLLVFSENFLKYLETSWDFFGILGFRDFIQISTIWGVFFYFWRSARRFSGKFTPRLMIVNCDNNSIFLYYGQVQTSHSPFAEASVRIAHLHYVRYEWKFDVWTKTRKINWLMLQPFFHLVSSTVTTKLCMLFIRHRGGLDSSAM